MTRQSGARHGLCRPATSLGVVWSLDIQGQAQPICINQQLLDTHLGNLAAQQIAYDRLVFVKDLHKLGLAVLPALHFVENCHQNLRFEF